MQKLDTTSNIFLSIIFQIDTMRNLLRTCEKNIKSEEAIRKSSIENLRSE